MTVRTKAWRRILFVLAVLPCAAATRTVVVLGSSTAQGVGASSYAASWVGRLTAAIAPQGFVVRNTSISGSNTGDSLARFDRDVTGHRPDFVILATSLFNEPKDTAVETYYRNTIALIRKVEAIGATPVIVGPYPNNTFSDAMYASIWDLYDRLSAEGVPLLNFLDAADDGRGHWIPGVQADVTHPNDIGHQILFESVPVSMFNSVSRPLVNPHGFGSWVQESGSDIEGGLEIYPTTTMSSWTVSFWMRPSEGAAERAVLSVNNSWLQVSRTQEGLSVRHAGLELGAVDVPPATGFRNFAVTYNAVTGALRVYVSGTLRLDRVVAPGVSAFTVRIGGVAGRPEWNAKGDAFSDVLVYRAPLRAADVSRISKLRPPWKSLEAWLPLTYSPSRPLLNLAPTVVGTAVHGIWSWSSVDFRAAAEAKPPVRRGLDASAQ